MNYNELSKEVSYALRHNPALYELDMDDEGWVSISQLIEALRRTPKWSIVNRDDIEQMISQSEKKRHEIVGDKIRAFYGHSVPAKIHKDEQKPPQKLYHGTARRFTESILQAGLLPQERQYVHLSKDINVAYQVGKRRDEHPDILTINAEDAFHYGVMFYFGNDQVWLAELIPAQFIKAYYYKDLQSKS